MENVWICIQECTQLQKQPARGTGQISGRDGCASKEIAAFLQARAGSGYATTQCFRPSHPGQAGHVIPSLIPTLHGQDRQFALFQSKKGVIAF